MSKKKSGFKRFLVLWVGQFLSSIGSGLTYFALGVYVYQQTGLSSSYTLILLCVFLPAILFKPLGGVLADRFDRRVLMFLGDLGSTLGLLFILLIMLYGDIQLWQIYFGVSMSAVFSAFHEPAYKSTLTDLLSKEVYAKGSGLIQLASSAQYLVSPFVAGFLLAVTRIEYIFIIDITTFLVANITVLLLIKIIGRKQYVKSDNTFKQDFKEGVKAFKESKGVMWLVFMVTVLLFNVGLLQSLLTPMLMGITDVKTVGVVQSISAMGMILGSIILGVFGGKDKHQRILALSLLLTGVFFSSIGVSISIIYITCAAFLFFTMLPFINTSIEVLIRNNIENEKQGRVWSIISLLTYFGSIIAFIFSGFLADKAFNPLLKSNGVLSDSVGEVIGVGEGRGIALMFILSGVFVSILSLLVMKSKYIRQLEKRSISPVT